MDKELGELVLQTIKQRLKGRQLVCGLCGGTRWGADGIISLPLQPSFGAGLVIGGKALPLISMTCDVCGYTSFHNVITLLGKEKFDEIIAEQKDKAKAVKEAEEITKGGQEQ